jgi:hypothetical protein
MWATGGFRSLRRDLDSTGRFCSLDANGTKGVADVVLQDDPAQLL